MIYCGSISLAVATGLYSCFCPKPIKDFSSGFDLAQNDLSISLLWVSAKLISKSVKHLRLAVVQRNVRSFLEIGLQIISLLKWSGGLKSRKYSAA